MEHLVAQVLTDLIRLIIVVIGTMLINYIRQHLSQQQINKAIEIAILAVKAAEAIGYACGLDSKAKFQEALQLARTTAARYGIRFTDDEWRALIEAAVQELKTIGAELHASSKASQNN